MMKLRVGSFMTGAGPEALEIPRFTNVNFEIITPPVGGENNRIT